MSTVPLDKKSLQLTLLSLIQDDRFLDLVHSQYLRVIHARAKKNHVSSTTSTLVQQQQQQLPQQQQQQQHQQPLPER
jgi:hypothetical protein